MSEITRRAFGVWAVVGMLAGIGAAGARGDEKSGAGAGRNVIFVSIDGLRWQEVFGGIDPVLVGPAGGVKDVAVGPVREAFARDSAEAGREAILPFFWDVVAKRGQVFGDRGVKHAMRVENPYRVSFPGYSEMLCGFVDPSIKNNENPPNPNVTVLEWLNKRPGFEGRVAAYGCWNRLRPIINGERSGLPIVAGWEPIREWHGVKLTEREVLLNELIGRMTRPWPTEPPDALICEAALEYVRKHKPRVFYFMLSEVDEWAHERRYDLYLEAARRSDDFIRRLWETVQGMEEYAGKTTLILTTDHGRGKTGADWTDHGSRVPGAEGTWAAVMGPGVEPLGVVRDGEVTTSQIAATIAGAVGEDWRAAEKRAARGLVEVRR